MTITVFTPDRLFAELSQDRFEDYDTFEQAFIERFNAHRFDLPIGFGWRDPGRVADYLSRAIPHRDVAEALLLQALPTDLECSSTSAPATAG